MSATKRRACRRIRFVGGPVHALRLEREVIALLLGIKALDDSADEDRSGPVELDLRVLSFEWH